VVIRFVDIGGIVGHHCLNVLFIRITFRWQHSEKHTHKHPPTHRPS